MAGWRYRAEGDGERAGQLGTGGQVWLDALAAGGAVEVGLVGVYGCRWDRDEARVGEPVGMGARCVGVADGAPAAFEVWRETGSAGGAARRAKVWEVAGAVRGGRVEADAPFVFAWPGDGEAATIASTAQGQMGAPPPEVPTLEGAGGYPGEERGTGTNAVYVVEAVVGGLHRARSGFLRYQDWLEAEVMDEEGRPVRSATVRFVTADGEHRLARTDSAGLARVEGLPPGPCAVELEAMPRRR